MFRIKIGYRIRVKEFGIVGFGSLNLSAMHLMEIRMRIILQYMRYIFKTRKSRTEFHVLGVNSQDLQTSNNIWDSNIDLPIESTESSKGRVDAVGSVCGCHDDNVSSLLHTVHQG